MTPLKALSDETRVRILLILSHSSFTVNEIVDILDMGQSRVSRHLKILSDAGLLKSRREGSWVYYELDSTPGISLELTQFLISHSSHLPESSEDQARASLTLEKREAKKSEFFDTMATRWEKIQEEVLNPSVYRKQILELLPVRTQRIVDLGCGPGGLIPFLLSRGQFIQGVDSSHGMVEVAKKQFQSNANVEILEAQLDSLPIDSTCVDTAITSMVLHHISNPSMVFDEVYRILKPGGSFIMVDLLKHNEEYMRDNFADLWLGFEPEVIEDWLNRSGFKIDKFMTIPTLNLFKIILFKAIKED
jgi:ArsR family transcriptional regulator